MTDAVVQVFLVPVGGGDAQAEGLYELRGTGGRYALVTMRIGGGQGIAAVFERI